MGIALWKSMSFFLAVAIFAVLLFPSQRELGSLYTQSGVMEQARNYLEDYFRKQPQDYLSTARYLNALLYDGQTQQFLKLTQQLIIRYPQTIAYYQALADYYEDGLMLPEAAEEWWKILQINSKTPDLKEKLLSYYKLSKNIPGMINFYQWKIKQGLGSLDDYYELAAIYAARKDIAQAKNTYSVLLAKYPRQEKAQLALAEAFEFTRQPGSALALYQQLYRQEPRNQEYVLVFAQKLLEYGKDKEASDLLAEALNNFPDDDKFINVLIDTYQRFAKIKTHLAVIEAFYRSHPGNTGLLKTLGQIYFDLNDYVKAEQLLRSYHEKTGGDYHTHHLLGDIFVARGDKGAGQREYLQALGLIRAKRK